MNSPSIFLSYSHQDKPVARALARALESGGATVWIDEGELRAGDSIIERIATAIDAVHFVVALVSPASVQSNWCRKELALALSGALNREGVKVMPLRLGDVTMPATLADTFYRTVDPSSPEAVAPELLADARSHAADSRSGVAPQGGATARVSSSVGRLTAGSRSTDGDGPSAATGWDDVHATGSAAERLRQAKAAGIAPADYARTGLADLGQRRREIADDEPVQVVGIVKEGVGRPRTDGTQGSALYAVPFRLSRRPSNEWARLLEATWDRPPEWTSMHRPGVCRVSGDVVTLDGVTIEEVEKYHLKTLKLCVARANESDATRLRDEAAARVAERERERAHAAALDEAIDRLDFS